MIGFSRVFRAAIAFSLSLTAASVYGQAAPAPQATSAPTIRVNSRLVFLDVTVLDRKGRPVVTGLSKDDFQITDEKRPQGIFSFEAPDARVTAEGESGAAPATILVLDALNSSFDDMAYIRHEAHKYLARQPEQLDGPMEILLLGNLSLEMLQAYTRSRAELIYAVDHSRTALPWKFMNGSFAIERVGQSIDALRQIALRNKGVPGRKNIVWVGHGAPSLYTARLVGPVVDKLNRYIHETTNMLVDARMSLFVIYPGLRTVGFAGVPRSQMSANLEIGEDDPFTGDINFGVFANETGGGLFYNRNDVDAEIGRSLELGSEYYTLTYEPPQGAPDGRFRRVRVMMSSPNLRAVTKAGYFAAEKDEPRDPRHAVLDDMSEAARSAMPFEALPVSVERIVRHSDTDTAQISIRVSPQNLGWHADDDGKTSTVEVGLEAVSLSKGRDVLTWKTQALVLREKTQDAKELAARDPVITMTVRVPAKARTVRVVLGLLDGGRMGAVEIGRQSIDAAPDAPTPEMTLQPRQVP